MRKEMKRSEGTVSGFYTTVLLVSAINYVDLLDYGGGLLVCSGGVF
jgi:hypothetical protein